VSECVFCRIARGEIGADVVAANEEFVAFRDLHPVVAQHVLVIPRQHVSSLANVDELGEGKAGRLLAFVAGVANHLGVGQDGYRVIVNTGRHAGQEVDHLHLHVLGGEPLGPLTCTDRR